ncbi:MAG: NAD(+)--arginine ADP-ribosyltransferase EFV [Firmicutes bacterium ADurb.Bin193]|nr:MAG: NAD(+)--arginine ADP-ribosyltransferase EFV [Firmicutes bacterium ADurb.Bin193]
MVATDIKTPSEKYWEKRAAEAEGKAHLKGEQLIQQLKKKYELAAVNVQKELAAFYLKYAKDNKVTYSDAVKALKGHWRVTRLGNLLDDINREISRLYDEMQVNIYQTMAEVYQDGYYRAAFNLSQGLGFQVSFTKPNAGSIADVLSYPWSGDSFSDRIWDNKQKLIKGLRQKLTQSFIQGAAVQKTASVIAKEMDVSYKNAMRLVRTEINYFANRSTKELYTAIGVKKYKFLATLDLRTSEICAGLDGKVFNTEDEAVGINYPPMHPHCRSTTIPYFPEDDLSAGGIRFARDAENNAISVPDSMTYEQWYKAQVDKYGEKTVKTLVKMRKNESADKAQFEKYKEVLGARAPKSLANYQNLKYNDSRAWEELKLEYKKVNSINRFRESIKNGKQELKIWEGSQGKHILTHNNYIEGRSYITISIAEAQELVNRYAGTGIIRANKKGNVIKREEILNNNSIVGVDLSDITNEMKIATGFVIHYTNRGTHIVPKGDW